MVLSHMMQLVLMQKIKMYYHFDVYPSLTGDFLFSIHVHADIFILMLPDWTFLCSLF